MKLVVFIVVCCGLLFGIVLYYDTGTDGSEEHKSTVERGRHPENIHVKIARAFLAELIVCSLLRHSTVLVAGLAGKGGL